MKKKATHFLYILLCTIILASCSKDDSDLHLTGVNGKPSSLRYSGHNEGEVYVYFYYQGSRLTRMKEIKGSITDFEYVNNELVTINSSPEDKNVADGHGSTTFTKEGVNKILIESWGEPLSNLFRQELELDENNTPLKITDMGTYSHTGANGEITRTRDGQYIAEFAYDPISKNLIKQTVYNKSTSEIHAIYEYEYDNNPGAVSKIGLPIWYYAYTMYTNREHQGYRLFFNYINNIKRETVQVEEQSITNYTYQYNKGNAPVSMGNDILGMPYITITY